MKNYLDNTDWSFMDEARTEEDCMAANSMQQYSTSDALLDHLVLDKWVDLTDYNTQFRSGDEI